MSQLLSDLTRLPVHSRGWNDHPATYVFYAGGKPFYVGMAGDVARRFQEHRRAGVCMAADRIEVFPCYSVAAAQRLERNLILFLNPSQNEALPHVSLNERHWYHAMFMATTVDVYPVDESWSWCPTCGELTLCMENVYLPATFTAPCLPCERSVPWDPRGFCWSEVSKHLCGLFGWSG